MKKMSNNLIGVDKMIMKVRMSLYLNIRVKKIIVKNLKIKKIRKKIMKDNHHN